MLALAGAPAQATTDEEDLLVYSVDVQHSQEIGGGGDAPDSVAVACQASACRLVAFPRLAGLVEAAPTFTVPGILAFTSEAQGGSCDALPFGPFDVDLTFTESSVSGTAVQEEWSIACADGELTAFGATVAVAGELVDGACRFTPEGCAGAGGLPRAQGASAVTIAYDVTTELRSIADDGSVTVERTEESSIRLRCEGETCMPEGGAFFPFGHELRAFPVPGSYEAQRAQSGDLCGGEYAQGGVTSLDFTAAGVTGLVRDDPIVSDCGGGTSSLFGSERVILESALVEGSCWFEPGGCAPAVDEDEPGSEDEGVVAQEEGGAGEQQEAAGGHRGTSSQLASGDPAAPSVLSALEPPAEAGITPQQLAAAALLTVILVLLMTFPTSLLNGAIDTASERFAAWRERRGAAPPPRWTGSWWWAATGVMAAALISAFVDPQFGANPGSLRVLLSIGISFTLEVVLGWVVLLWLMRRLAPSATRSFSFRPLSLLVVVAAVVFTRITGFEPGIVFGLVAGLGFAATMGIAARARTTLVPLGYAFALGLLAWLSYGLVAGAAGDSFGMTLLVETLASLTVGGIVALPLALLPVKGLGGHSVWQADRRLWAGCYGIGLFAFFVVLMPMPTSWAGVGWELWAWIGAYVAYALVAVVAWLIAKRPWEAERGAAASPPPAEAPAPADQAAMSAPSTAPQPEEIR